MVYKFDDENKLRGFDGEKFALLCQKNVKDKNVRNEYRERIEERARKRKELPKKILKWLMASVLSVSLIVAAFWPKISRDIELHEANKFMDKQIEIYMNEEEIAYNSIGQDLIFSSEDAYKKLDEILKDKGFTEHQILYVIYKTCGVNEFHKMAQFYGYRNGQDFLDKHYLNGNNLSYDGELIRNGEIRVLENYIQDEYVKTVEELIEAIEKKVVIKK